MAGNNHRDVETAGALDPDFLAVGLGGTGMMSMLWSVAMGKTAVGVELRGDPFLGVHWNLRVDLYHQLGLIDEMMLDRWGEDRLPRMGDGRPFLLSACFYGAGTVGGDIVADEIIDGFDRNQHIVGTIQHVEFIDDRWRDGLPHRVVTVLSPPPPPDRPDPTSIRNNMIEVLDGPSTFQAGAASVLVLLRRYLEKIEQMDQRMGYQPRVRLFSRHRVVTADGDGFIDRGDGRLQVRVEALQEFDFKGKFVRVRAPGTEVIDIGVPELFMIAEGFHSVDAHRLGFRQHDVEVDHHDGRGPVVAQADFLAGLIGILVGGRLRRRISSAFDGGGTEYWARQIAVGHEADPEVGWVLVQVPDFKTLDPIEEGLVAEGTDPDSPEYFAAYQHVLYDFYLEQAGEILELSKDDLRKIEMVYGPKMFSLVERVGDDAQLAANGVVAGDSFGNGHFLTSGGAVTGMVGHSFRVLRYWEARNEGVVPEVALRDLADGIKDDTMAWLEVSAKEYTEAVPINFGAERIAQIAAATGATGTDAALPVVSVDSSRRRRHSLLPLDPSDWRRLFLRNGAIRSAPLPPLRPVHPALRSRRRVGEGAEVTAVYVAPRLDAASFAFIWALVNQPDTRIGLITEDPTSRLPERLRDRLAGWWQVADSADPNQIDDALTRVGDEVGAPDVLLSTNEQLQVALAELGDARGLAGPGADAARRFSDKARMLERLRGAGLPVITGPPPDGAVACTMAMITAEGVPAWSAATRADHTFPAGYTVTLPREDDDPGDGAVRRLGVAALKAIGVPAGLAHIMWFRLPDGRPVLADLSAQPPAAEIMAVMSHAYGADMYRAWANAVLQGPFAPIPRLSAAGVAFVPRQGTGDWVRGLPGWKEARAEMGDLIVEVGLPQVGQLMPASGGPGGYLVVRHADTGVVDAALRRLVSGIRVEVG